MSSKVVVITYADFIGRNCVVLVGNGDHASAFQVHHGLSGVDKSTSVSEIRMGHQDLSDRELVYFEGIRPAPHELWLTCGGKSLLLDECARTSVDAEQRKALCNGAAGYQHDMAPGLRKGRHLDREALEC